MQSDSAVHHYSGFEGQTKMYVQFASHFVISVPIIVLTNWLKMSGILAPMTWTVTLTIDKTLHNLLLRVVVECEYNNQLRVFWVMKNGKKKKTRSDNWFG